MQYTDQLHRTLSLPAPPRRIVSLVPSQTELLSDLGLEQQVVGITKFCIHPEAWFRNKTRVGGTKTVKLEKVHELKPDLIIGNKEENTREDIEALAADFPVWMSDVNNLEDAVDMIRGIGQIVDREEKAEELAASLQSGFDELARHLQDEPHPRAAYLIWRRPYMAVGRETFIHDMLHRAGFTNALAHHRRYPEISLLQLKAARPEVILLSSEPYPFKDQHLEEFREACPQATIQLVDGELFSWYGSRLLQSPAYFRKLRARLLNNDAVR